MSRFLGTKPLLSRYAQKPEQEPNESAALTTRCACVPVNTLDGARRGVVAGCGSGQHPPLTPAQTPKALAGVALSFFQAPRSLENRGRGRRPIPCSFCAPPPHPHFSHPSPAPCARACAPAPTCHSHADRGDSVGEVGRGLVAAAPPPPVCSLVRVCVWGRRWRCWVPWWL